MKRFLLIVCTLGVFACNGKKMLMSRALHPHRFWVVGRVLAQLIVFKIYLCV